MSMERHRCNLCSKLFNNGRALGGHMRSHLASLPLPPPKKKILQSQLGESTQSDSSSTQSEGLDLVGVQNEKFSAYWLRDNPKSIIKASVPEFLESETESTQGLTRKRSKRVCRSQKLFGTESKKLKSESATESTPASSVSDPGHQDEEVALCLMMLSRDVWDDDSVADTNDSSELIMTRPSGTRFKCVTCNKVFKTRNALKGHNKANNKECQQDQITTNSNENGDQDVKIFECPFCYKVFGSGQALGGHKRSHLLGLSSTNNSRNNMIKSGENATTSSFVLDLNLPPPVDDHDDDDEDHGHLDFH